MITVYNTLGRSLQPFEPLHPERVGMYVCGPTVQSEPHLGHGRFAVVFDVIRRYLAWRGFDVTYVRNITDVEDKIIAAASASGESMSERAEKMAAKFHGVFEGLRVLPPDVEPKATEHIPEMIDLIGRLIENGLAYVVDTGDVYFAVRALAEYGKLSGRDVDDLRSGARVDVSEIKRDPLDFALWKAAKPGEPSWESPWSAGRPGWHIECSAMAAKYLGDSFDIHGGGSDLIFPHHENEIAQSEGATGAPFARYWLHNGMVNLGGEKMSKSTGLLVDLATAIDQYGGVAVRLLYLRAHYRSPLEFTGELVAESQTALDRIGRLLDRAPRSQGVEPEPDIIRRFVEAMDSDFATPEAVGVLFEAVREANRLLDSGSDAAPLVAAVHELVDLLAIRPNAGLAGEGAEAIEMLVRERDAARAVHDFTKADRIRDELATMGLTIEDGPDGTRWSWN